MATPIIFWMRKEEVPLNIIRTHIRPRTGMFHSFRFLSCLCCFKFADCLVLVISQLLVSLMEMGRFPKEPDSKAIVKDPYKKLTLKITFLQPQYSANIPKLFY